MRLRKVRFKNGYKRFRDLAIDLGENPARIVALVGPNGCGKSSVLDGIIYHISAYRPLGNGGRRDHTYHSLDSEPSVSYEDVEIEFTDGSYHHVREQREKSGRENTIFSFRSPYRYNSYLKIKETRSANEIFHNNEGASDTASLDGKMEENYRRLYAAYNRYMESEDLKPSEARAKIIGDLNRSISSCIDLQVSSIGNVEGGRGTLYFKKADHPREFEFNVLSSGEKEVVDLLVDLYLRKEHYNESIFLIDEPELHINTSIQRKLLIEINRLVGEDCQIWITTHSIGFLRALQTDMRDECQIIQFRPEFELASKPLVLKPILATPVMWRALFEIALDDLAYLVSPKVLVYCEGRAEPGNHGSERGMDAQVFNSIFCATQPDVLFVSSGGNTELDQRSTIAVAILGKVFPTLEILVLKDRDMASGKVTDENERQTYLSANPRNHRVLKRWEIENYLYDKEVLKVFCSGRNLHFDEAAYDCFVTDITNQNLKDSTGHIRSFCNIKGSVNADAFKIELSKWISQEMEVFKELDACIFHRV